MVLTFIQFCLTGSPRSEPNVGSFNSKGTLTISSGSFKLMVPPKVLSWIVVPNARSWFGLTKLCANKSGIYSASWTTKPKVSPLSWHVQDVAPVTIWLYPFHPIVIWLDITFPTGQIHDNEILPQHTCVSVGTHFNLSKDRLLRALVFQCLRPRVHSSYSNLSALR
jgi:hypothetical protein